MNEGELHEGNVDDKSIDSSVPEYAPLSPLSESGSESGKTKAVLKVRKKVQMMNMMLTMPILQTVTRLKLLITKVKKLELTVMKAKSQTHVQLIIRNV